MVKKECSHVPCCARDLGTLPQKRAAPLGGTKVFQCRCISRVYPMIYKCILYNLGSGGNTGTLPEPLRKNCTVVLGPTRNRGDAGTKGGNTTGEQPAGQGGTRLDGLGAP